MKVKLIDLDSKIPNLALMQLSAYHKSLGDEVGFDINNPDKTYVSCIFTKNKEQALGFKSMYDNVDIGGSGVSLTHTIPLEAQKIKPDYSLYPGIDYDIGFTTRGCIRHCPFCIVRDKEGELHRWQHISEFHDESHKTVKLLDNNFYADRDWFFENTDYILEHNLKLDVTQGMDARIMTDEIAERLSKIRWTSAGLHFAWDNIKDEKSVLKGIDTILAHGVNPRMITVFVLAGFNSSFEEDLYRCNTLKSMGVCSFVMRYDKLNEQTKKLAHWANRRWIYFACDFKDYDNSKKGLNKVENRRKKSGSEVL